MVEKINHIILRKLFIEFHEGIWKLCLHRVINIIKLSWFFFLPMLALHYKKISCFQIVSYHLRYINKQSMFILQVTFNLLNTGPPALLINISNVKKQKYLEHLILSLISGTCFKRQNILGKINLMFARNNVIATGGNMLFSIRCLNFPSAMIVWAVGEATVAVGLGVVSLDVVHHVQRIFFPNCVFQHATFGSAVAAKFDVHVVITVDC